MRSRSTAINTQAQVDAASKKTFDDAMVALKAANTTAASKAVERTTNADGSSTWTVVVGGMVGPSDLQQFYASKLDIRLGDTVVWKSAVATPHTATFLGGTALLDLDDARDTRERSLEIERGRDRLRGNADQPAGKPVRETDRQLAAGARACDPGAMTAASPAETLSRPARRAPGLAGICLLPAMMLSACTSGPTGLFGNGGVGVLHRQQGHAAQARRIRGRHLRDAVVDQACRGSRGVDRQMM